MSTLAEIEAAIDQLPAGERQQLLQRISQAPMPAAVLPSSPRKLWLERLSRLRASVGAGNSASTSESILNDLRAERG